jgi:ParB-like chromosome segregation protein Spo0J
MQYVDLPASAIQTNPDNPAHRSIPDPLLVQDIKHRGIIDALIVAEQGQPHSLYDGHRRLAAGIAAGLAKFPCLKIKGDVAPEEIRLVTSLHKKDLSCPEKVHNYLALRRLHPGSTAKDLAARLSIDPSLASMYQCYENCTPKVQKAFDDGKLVLKAMNAISRQPPEAQGELLEMSLAGMPGEEIARRARKRVNGSSKEQVRVARIKIDLGNVTVTFSGKDISLEDAIEAAPEAAKVMKKGRDEGLTAKTISKASAERAKAGG